MRLPPDEPSATAVTEQLSLSAADSEFLAALGKRVRTIRERRATTRKQLARDADVSERYLALLEAGEGNISVLLLRRIAAALDVGLTDLLVPEQEDTVEARLIRRFLARVPVHRLEDVIFRLMRDYGEEDAIRRTRIALVGLRGAGKSTLGRLLADALGCSLVELDQEIERDTGLPLHEIISLNGQAGYRRLERKTLERVLTDERRVVLVAAGGIVSQEDTFNLLLANCYTVWIKAQPEEHMARVLAQGDFRPMAGNDEAMQDLRHILESREPLYRKADAIVDTSGEAIEESLAQLRKIVETR